MGKKADAAQVKIENKRGTCVALLQRRSSLGSCLAVFKHQTREFIIPRLAHEWREAFVPHKIHAWRFRNLAIPTLTPALKWMMCVDSSTQKRLQQQVLAVVGHKGQIIHDICDDGPPMELPAKQLRLGVVHHGGVRKMQRSTPRRTTPPHPYTPTGKLEASNRVR